MALTKMYLYLARRDKGGVKLLMVFMGEPRSGRVDVATLGLPPDMRESIDKEVYDNRMLWEPWLEPAESFHQLKGKLHERGFTNLPLSSSPLINQIKGHKADTTQVVAGRKSMVQKKR